jgi:hypothetical protein
MTSDEAAAIALAFAALSDDATAAVDHKGRPLHESRLHEGRLHEGRPLRPSWSTIEEPRTWMDFARRDALSLDVDV